MKLLALACGLLALGACAPVEQQRLSQDYFAFGRYEPGCSGDDCPAVYVLDQGKLLRDDEGHFDPSLGYTARAPKPLDSALYAEAMALRALLPAELATEGRVRIGQTEQGGYFVQTTLEGDATARFWILDSRLENLPEYLLRFVDLMGKDILLFESFSVYLPRIMSPAHPPGFTFHCINLA